MNELNDTSPPNLRPAKGTYADGFEPVVNCFAKHLASGAEIGASLAIYHKGKPVVDIWGGYADVASGRLWTRDTRIVLFSVTKGFVTMALHLLADRGLLDFSAPVAQYWPEFGQNGKAEMTVGTLVGHRGGLSFLDTPLTMEDCMDPARADFVREALERQAPAWKPGTDQGYHALTFGLYARELFERIAGEPLRDFLRRELMGPLNSDVWIGAPSELDSTLATLYPAGQFERASGMIKSAILRPNSTEARVFRGVLAPNSLLKKTFLNPRLKSQDLREYNKPPICNSTLAWGSGTGSGRGIARAYLPFANGGEHGGTRFLAAATIRPAYTRIGWSDRDKVLQKPLGWSNGFLKEEARIFGEDPESFGHAGMGGALGWCNPVKHLTFGYAQNRMDWRIRSPRAIALTHAMYQCDPVRG